jgi:PHP family Zn ribbon phosphoesterase
MAKYSKKAQDKVAEVLQEFKEGKLKSGPGGKGGKVKSRKQAIAIGLSEAREAGAKVPEKKT